MGVLINQLPTEIRNLALQRQSDRNNIPDPNIYLSSLPNESVGFWWNETEEGEIFWDNIDDKYGKR